MIYVSIIAIILWPLLAGFISNLINVKNKILTSFLSIMVLLQTVWFFIMLNPNIPEIYNITKIIFIVSITTLFVYFLLFSFWKYKSNKVIIDISKIKSSLLASLKEYIPYALAFGIALIFILFTWIVDHDTWYYIKISNNFKQSVFTSDGTSLLANNIYRFPAMYYVIAVFFPENIQTGYFLLMPLINVFIGVASMNLCISRFKPTDQWKHIAISSLLSVSLMFIILSTISYSTSGNTVIQGLLIAAIVSNIFSAKDFEIKNSCITICLSMSYFSSTGLMIGLPIIIAIFLIRSFRIGINKTIELVPVMLILIIASLITFLSTSDADNSFFSTASLSIAYYVIFSACSVFLFALSFFKQKIWMKPMDIASHIRINKLCNIIFIVLFVATIIGTICIWGFGFSGNRSNYLRGMWIFYMFIYSLLGFFFLYQLNKLHEINYFILFLFVLNTISLLEASIGYALKINDITNSLWRLNFLIIGFGNIPDICIFLGMIIVILISPMHNYYKNKSLRNTFKISLHSRKISLISSSLLSCVSLFICLNSYFKIFADSFLMKFNSDVIMNTQNVSNADMRIINSLEFHDFSDSYLTDLQISFLINNGVDLTYRLGRNLDNGHISYPWESYQWNFYNFTHSVDQWNRTNSEMNQIKNDASSISEHLVITINDLATNPEKSINGDTIDKIKYFIFNKNTLYFTDIENTLSSLSYSSIDGENIMVFHK